jgi:hypothetical protein
MIFDLAEAMVFTSLRAQAMRDSSGSHGAIADRGFGSSKRVDRLAASTPTPEPNLVANERPIMVVHVVRDPGFLAPQKTHAPLTKVVNLGSLWSIRNANRAACFGECAGR